MPSWDEDSPQLRWNLSKVLDEIVLAAERREYPTIASAKRWQSLLMKNLPVPDARFVGAFRGEPGLEKIQVRVGSYYALDVADVAQELTDFEKSSMRSSGNWTRCCPLERNRMPINSRLS